MPSHGRRAGRGVRTPGTTLRTRLATATSTRPILAYPRSTSRQSLHLCAFAHTGRVLFLGCPADPGSSCLPLSRQGGTRGGRLTAGESGRRKRIPSNANSPSPKIQRGASQLERAEGGPNRRRTARRPWRAASTNLQCDAQLGAPLGSPSPWASPLPRSTRRDAQGWASPASWRIAGWQGRTQRPCSFTPKLTGPLGNWRHSSGAIVWPLVPD